MSSEDYFELKYNEEVYELFNEFKGIFDHYQVHYKNKNNHMDFLYFIMNSVTIHYNDDSEEEEEEAFTYEKKYKI